MPMTSRVVCAAGMALVSTVLLSTACSSESNDDQTLSVAITPGSVNVAAGGSTTAAATITRGGGFGGVATLTATGAPAGVTVALTPAAIAAGATTGQVNVSVGAAVAPGTYPIVIHAAGSGVATATAALSVVVLPGAVHGFTLAAAPASLATPAGGVTQTSIITISRQAPFASTVFFSITGMPAGVTASLSPSSATGTSSTLSVSVGAGTVNGTYSLVVRGTGIGVSVETTTVGVTVTGGAAGGVTLALAPPGLSISAGGATALSTLTISRAGTFTGAVAVGVTGMPAGMTAVPEPASVTGTDATITVGATSTVPPGSYSLMVTATGTGISPASIQLPLTVSAPLGSVTFSFCATNAPLWLAIQDGDGAWTRLTPGGNNSYTFSFGSGRGGIATVDTVGTATELRVFYATSYELTSVENAAAQSSCRTHTLSGTVAGLGTTDVAHISIGLSTQSVPANGPFTIAQVARGRQYLVATRTDTTTFHTSKVILRRSVSVVDGGTIPTLDFGVEGFEPATIGVTVKNLGGQDAVVSSSFDDIPGAPGALIGLIPSYHAAGTSPVPIAIVQGSALAGEEQLVQAAVTGTNTFRSAGAYIFTPYGLAPMTITMGPVLSAPAVSNAATTPYIQPRVQLTKQASYDRLISANYRATGSTASMSIAATAAYSTSSATWTLTFPNLSSAAGWNNAWGIATGVPFDWDVTAQGGAIALFDEPYYFDVATTQTASQSSSAPIAARALGTGGSLLGSLHAH